MLRTRILSAIVLLPIVLGALVLGGGWFSVLVALALSLASWEFVGLARRAGHDPFLPAALALVWLLLVDSVWPELALLRPGLALILLLSLLRAMICFNRGASDPLASWALTILAGLYVGWLGSHFVRLRGMENGLYWTLIALGSTWLADSGAYAIGRRWGRHKMAPRLSPGKSWEGLIGGLLVGSVSTTVLALACGVGVVDGLVIGVLVATISPLGDLGVSMIKRQVGAKDTSHLIPGHGGLLDRLDSLLISVTLVTYYVSWVVLQ